MAEFNAGSIKGSLDLDLDPFQRGLDQAAVDADQWEAKHGKVTATADLDTAKFDVEKDKVTADVDKLGAESANVKVNVDTAEATSKLLAFKGAEDAASGADGGGHGMLYLIGLAASLAPALAPGVASLALFGSAALAGMAQAGIGLGAFVAVAKSDFAELQAAIAKGTKLKGPAGEAEAALKSFDKAWEQVKKDTAGPVFGVMTKALHDAAGLLPHLVPLVDSVAKGLSGSVGQINKWLSSPSFQNFLKMIAKDAVPDLKNMTAALVNFGKGFVNVIEALNPVTTLLVQNLDKLSKQFLGVSQNLKNGGIQQVLNFIRQYAPLAGQMIHDLFTGIINLAKGLAPLVGPALLFLDSLFKAVGGLNIAPLAAAFSSLLSSLGPVLTLLGNLLNIIIPPLATVIGTLVGSYIEPLVSSLGKDLTPVVQALGGFLDDMAKPLGIFLGDVANLVNPTGVGALSKLLVGALKAVTPLIDPLFNVADALEAIVDDGLNAIMPLLPTFTGLLSDVATNLAPVVQGLADILANKAVVDVILGLYGATKLWAGALVGLEIISAIAGFMKDFSLASIAETAALKGMFIWEGLVAALQYIYDAALGIGDVVGGIFDAELWAMVGAEIAAAAPFVLLAGVIAAVIGAVIELVKHWHAVWDILKSVAEYIAGSFAQAWREQVAFFKGLGHDIESIFSGSIHWLESAGKWIITGLFNGAKAVWKTASSWWTYIENSVVTAFDEADTWLISAGESIITGLLTGIGNLATAPVKAIEKIGGNVIKAAKGVFKQNSPSKVFMDIGSGIIEGLQLGFQQEYEQSLLPYVNSSMAALTDNAEANANATLKVTSTVGQSSATATSLSQLQDHLDGLTKATTQLGTDMAAVMGSGLGQIGATLATSHDKTAKAVVDGFTKASTASTDKLIQAART